MPLRSVTRATHVAFGGEDWRMTAVRIVVHGQVQGVGFRAHTARAARELGVTGSARNLPDGTVEVDAYGPHEGVDALTAWINGPSAPGRVDDVDVTRMPEGRTTPSSFTTG